MLRVPCRTRETAVELGLADAIADVVQTGASL
jgi:ATP phosphoribosyltransferase